MEVRVVPHNGRPLLSIDGRVTNPAMFCVMDLGSPESEPVWRRATERFAAHDMDVYLVGAPHRWEHKRTLKPLWDGDTIGPEVMPCDLETFDKGPAFVLDKDPDAYVMIRFLPRPPKSWQDLHPDHCVQRADGVREGYPSMASRRYAQQAATWCAAYLEFCLSRPWGERCMGFVNYSLCEGCHGPTSGSWLYDYSPVMVARWREWLTARYGDDRTLREAWGDDELSLETVAVPQDPLRGPLPAVAETLYWQAGPDNQFLRDWLLFTRDLYHENLRLTCEASRQAAPGRLLLHDAFKLPMQGWNNHGFFNPDVSWPVQYVDIPSGSGIMDVFELLGSPGMDGVCTPYDYQVRGPGGVFEPEGIADSCALRQRPFFVEQDIRTYCGGFGHYGTMRNMQEFQAVMWRDLATALTRGFMNYFCDHNADYHAEPAMHDLLERQVEVLHRSPDWVHETVPGIAMVLDDRAALETNGGGHVFNEAVMWEQKTGISRCGVPCRVYILDDLALDDFPEHRVIYFPNLYRVDDERLDLLRRKVFRDGRVVVWGPGCGVSDGRTIAPEHATRLTGFQYTFEPVNYQHRVQIERWDHPITANLPADCIFGGALSYGPMLYPTDGQRLGMAWSKQGKQDCGLAIKDFGGYHGLVTTAVPLPAALWREIARFAGAHVWSETNDVLLADSALVALHSLKPGPKHLALPGPRRVTDLKTGAVLGEDLTEVAFTFQGCDTAVYRLE